MPNKKKYSDIQTFITKESERITTNRMTKYERTVLIGKRAEMFSHNCKPNIDYPKELAGKYLKIAELELKAKKSPLLVSRPLPDGTHEIISANELIYYN